MEIGNLFYDGDTYFHKLDGSIKLLLLIMWTILVFSFMDYRIFIILILIGSLMFRVAEVPFAKLKSIVIFIIFFTIFNSVFLLLITPMYGSELTGTVTPIIQIGNYKITYETLFYTFTLSLKYFSLLPMTLIFVFTTHPSKFASSLNKVKINYKISYAVNLSLRYIPDIMDEYKHIKNALMLKGIDFENEKSKLKKLANYRLIIVPLIKLSIDRIDIISSGMDLRSFGLSKTRTWYNSKKYDKTDKITLLCITIFIVIYFTIISNMTRGFYYPF